MIIIIPKFIFFNKYQYIKYTEQNNTTYKVYLKENDFFNKDYLLKDNEYIPSNAEGTMKKELIEVK